MPYTENYRHDLHALRGFAIINIVLIHVSAWYFYNLGQQVALPISTQILNDLTEMAFHGSTIYFALISGILASRVLAHRGWPRFFRNKARYVLLPYLICSLLFSLVWFAQGDCIVWSLCTGGELGVSWHGPLEFAQRYLKNVIGGTTVIPYWYIPVLLVLFAGTPGLVWLARQRPTLLWVLAVVALTIQRGGPWFNVPSLIYFLGIYAVAIGIGADYEGFLQWAERRISAIVVAIIISSICLTAAYALGIWFMLETVHAVHKLAITAAVLVAFNRWQSIPRWLSTLGTHAFAIFFLHLFLVVAILGPWLRFRPQPAGAVEALVVISLIAMLTLVGCLIVSTAIKAIVGRRSRMMIGA